MLLISIYSANSQTVSEVSANVPKPPIPVPFALKEAGYVTLVVENSSGFRVRNLISGVRFEAGKHIVWWDGMDEGRTYKPSKGQLRIGGQQLVAPGTYRVRGLWHKGIELRWEFAVNTAGDPPWFTGTNLGPVNMGPGGWLADHTPPADVLYLPGNRPPHYQASQLSVTEDGYQSTKNLLIPSESPLVMIGSPIAEAGHGMVWTDLEGRKVGGIRGYGHGGRWMPGVFALARDEGDRPVPGTYAYYAIPYRKSKNDTQNGRIYVQTLPSDRTVYEPEFQWAGKENDAGTVLGGIAVRNGVLVVAMRAKDALTFVDTRVAVGKETGREIAQAHVKDPRGVAFDRQGRLLVLSGTELYRYDADMAAGTLAKRQVLVRAGLEDPQRISLDPDGNIYVSDWGESHQVKVFASDGRALRTIGKPGAPRVGPYDEQHMNCPLGVTITPDKHVWVAESFRAPKRVSIWNLDGTFVKAMYGPAKYGGGGCLDEQDPTRFYYAEQEMALQYRLDWQSGTARLSDIYYLRGKDDLPQPPRYLGPQKPIYVQGRRYMTNSYSTWATYGAAVVSVWQMRNEIAEPVAVIGQAAMWPALENEAFKSKLPKDVNLTDPKLLFAWSDRNGDRQVQVEELTFQKCNGSVLYVTIQPDLSALVSTATQILRLPVQGFAETGAPLYDVTSAQMLADEPDAILGGNNTEALLGKDGSVVRVGGPLRGYRDGKLMWTYSNQWPSLHAGHEAPSRPQYPGQLIATTRLMNWAFTPAGTDLELWALNADRGNSYLFSTDGLYVGELGRQASLAEPWPQQAQRGQSLTNVNFYGENFWPTINQTTDGKVYMINGKQFCGIVRVDGLESLRRLPQTSVSVTPELLAQAQVYSLGQETARQQKQAAQVLQVAIRIEAPTVDGKIDDWAKAQWVRLDEDIEAAVCLAGDRLYAAWKTSDPDLLKNTGESGPSLLFKTGGALDLMLATAPAAKADRTQPAAGDVRLLVSKVQGQTLAVLYRPVVPGTPKPLLFSSPARTVTIARADTISYQVKVATAIRIVTTQTWQGPKNDTYHDYELSVPLKTLRLSIQPGQEIRGDIGVLRGQNGQTFERLYWHNKATGITSDVPSEAMLTPALWGTFKFNNSTVTNDASKK
jgi:hypothetical protein